MKIVEFTPPPVDNIVVAFKTLDEAVVSKKIVVIAKKGVATHYLAYEQAKADINKAGYIFRQINDQRYGHSGHHPTCLFAIEYAHRIIDNETVLIFDSLKEFMESEAARKALSKA
jgi:hypothetical protein